MGVYREFNFQDDIELLNLKYQMTNGNFMDYFVDERTNDGRNIEENTNKLKLPKDQL